MNYYQRYGGDYARDTGHLSLAEHGAYTLLLDVQYSTESGLPQSVEALCRICRAMGKAEQAAVRAVAEAYFPIAEDGLRWNPRAARDLRVALRRIAAAKQNGKRGGSPLKKAGYNEPGFLYAIRRKAGGPIKVGITKNPRQRFSELASRSGPIDVLAAIEVSDMGSSEAAVHAAFASVIDGEWIAAEEGQILRAVRAQQAAQLGAQRAAMLAAQQAAHAGEASPAPTPDSKDQNLNPNVEFGGKPPPKLDVVPLVVDPEKPPRLQAEAAELLAFLNERTQRHFRPTKTTLRPVMARLKEGYTLSECRAVVARKVRQWSADDKMRDYLRPATLFGAEKFAQYVGEVPPPEEIVDVV